MTVREQKSYVQKWKMKGGKFGAKTLNACRIPYLHFFQFSSFFLSSVSPSYQTYPSALPYFFFLFLSQVCHPLSQSLSAIFSHCLTFLFLVSSPTFHSFYLTHPPMLEMPIIQRSKATLQISKSSKFEILMLLVPIHMFFLSSFHEYTAYTCM